MEDIYKDLNIPKKQIRATSNENPKKFQALVHKTWIKSIIENKKLLHSAPVYKDEDINIEWPKKHDLDVGWDFVYIVVYKKQPLKKVIPLPKIIQDTQDHLPLTYSQLLQQIQQANHKNLWKQNHKKFTQNSNESKKFDEPGKKKVSGISVGNSNNNNFMAYDVVLREVIMRLYEIPIMHSKLDKTGFKDNENRSIPLNSWDNDRSSFNHNLLPIIGAIESNTHYYLIFDYVENTVADCLSYSPAILDKSHNKNLFLIYQLLKFIKFMHSRGLLMGSSFSFNDVLMKDNLMLYIIPKIEANLIEYEETDSTLSQDSQMHSVGKALNIHSLNYQYSLREICEMWCQGKISNFDYLTILNNFAGRKQNCPENSHIMPWIIDFTSKQGNWRDLTKSKYRLNKGDRQLDLTYQHSSNVSTPHHVSESLSEITYYVYMARKTPKSILCKHVRSKFVANEYPVSIKRLQEWTPDEAIPEFYSDPSVFKSIHEDLPDLEIPAWATCPEDFIMKHRETLESQYVSENLHHWIDLNFGYKLSGKAAIKAKNVCLTLVDQHKTLCQKGIIQLFDYPHPPKQTKNVWFGKVPPRISSEVHRRMTRSSEDLSMENNYLAEENQPSTSSSPRNTNRLAHQSESIERSTSYHTNVQRPTNQILLPRNFNPIAQLKAVENMENFLSKTFYDQQPKKEQEKINLPASIMTNSFLQNYLSEADSDNAFTNRIFLETYEASLIKDNKMYRNMKHKNFIAENSKRNFKQILMDHRQKELQVVGCLIVELFNSTKIRPLVSLSNNLEERLEAAKTVLKHNLNLPKCVQYSVKLFLETNDFDEKITDKGLPGSALDNFLIEPIMSNQLIPFPDFYIRIYAALQTIHNFDSIISFLNYYMHFECNGKICTKVDDLEKFKMSVIRRVAECNVKSFVVLVNDLIEPKGLDQFGAVEILLPYILNLFNSEDKSILAAWHIFDSIAMALGIEQSKKILLNPVLQLYDIQNVQLNSNFESMRSFQATSIIFKSRKAVKLYHHSFLLKLIVRFGLKCFLENFIVPLIESVGSGAGHREFDIQHLHKTTLTKKTEVVEDVNEEVFAFESDDQQLDTEKVIIKMLDHLEVQSESSSLDLRLNHSSADEMTEDHYEDHIINDFTIGDEKLEIYSTAHSSKTGPKSPEIAIPSSFKRSIEVNSINCEIGSRQSTDSFDFMPKTLSETPKLNQDGSEKANKHSSKSVDNTKLPRSARISEMSSESIIWLAHRLGPVLTARYITRNLLKMLTLCYVSQENLMPSSSSNYAPHICHFTVCDGNVVGDECAENVIDSLTSIAALFGEEFILLQYFPHISELVGMSKNRMTQTLEGGLISSLVLIKCLIPCMSDKIILEQLQDTILRNIVNPIIRLLGSCRLMPSGFLARSVLARKLLDTMYAIAVRIGVEFTKKNLCVPSLQRFFLIFDKAFGNQSDTLLESSNPDPEQSQENLSVESSEDSTYLEVQKDGKTTEWKVKKNIMLPTNEPHSYNPVVNVENSREKGLEEIRDVFSAGLAHNAYLLFLNLLGESVMKSTLKNNFELIINLSHDHDEIPSYSAMEKEDKFESTQIQDTTDGGLDCTTNSFNSNVAIVGNRIDVQFDNETTTTPINSNEVQKLVAYKLENCVSNRKLRGNWLAYWSHEIGRSEKDTTFNLKQIKLQQYSGHTNSIRSIICLDNENSFMSASKDKTVKLWSLRNEGDGNKVTSCQYTYNNHRKSVHSLTFLDSMRLAVSCDSGVHLWDPFVGSLVNCLDNPKYGPVTVIKSYPSGSSLVLAGTAETTVRVIDGRTCDYVCDWKVTTAPSGSIRCLAISPSGNWIAVGQSSGVISLLDARTGIIDTCWKASEGELLQLLAPNEYSLISSSIDQNMSVWNVKNASLNMHFKNPPEPSHCLRMYENKLIAATPGNRIGTFDLGSQDNSNNNQISFTRLRSDLFRGILSSFEILPMNRMILAGSENGHIILLV